MLNKQLLMLFYHKKIKLNIWYCISNNNWFLSIFFVIGDMGVCLRLLDRLNWTRGIN